MKSKFYLATAAALALAACTNEEDLVLQNPSNQVSPISFVIGTDDAAETRAHWFNGYTLAWDANDLTTLYHGGAAGSLANSQNQTHINPFS